MGATDPTYPLFSIAGILAAAMLLVVLLTSFVRQNWNLGVTFLCFWLFLENLANAVSAILWSDNADIKHYIYCDIVSHLQEITFIVKPMATLIITRRLYLIASFQSVELPNELSRRRNLVVEWTLGLFVPLLVAGPIYYVHQGTRFQIIETFGCQDSASLSTLKLLTIDIWTLIPPLISILIYYPKVIRMFYRQRRDSRSFLNTNTSVSRTTYLRILVLASTDILLTLPISIASIVLGVTSAMAQGPFPFYWGWTFLHSGWDPVSYTYAELRAFGPSDLGQNYFSIWSSVVLAFVIFGLFGITSDALASYWHIICTICSWVGWNPTLRARNGRASLGEIKFGSRPQDMSLGDLEMGSGHPSLVIPETLAAKQSTEDPAGESGPSASESESIKEVRLSSGDTENAKHRVQVDLKTIGAAV